MNIEIHDAALEARIQKLLRASGSSSVEEVLLRLVETQEEQDRWFLENRTTVNAKIRTGIDQLDRGEGIPDDRARLRGRRQLELVRPERRASLGAMVPQLPGRAENRRLVENGPG